MWNEIAWNEYLIMNTNYLTQLNWNYNVIKIVSDDLT